MIVLMNLSNCLQTQEENEKYNKKCLIALKFFLNNIDTKSDLANHRAMLEFIDRERKILRMDEEKEGKPIKYRKMIS
jgi:hypothetical protein